MVWRGVGEGAPRVRGGGACDGVGGAPREGRSEHVAVQAGGTHPPLPRGRGQELEGKSVNGRPLAVGGNERQLQHLDRSRVRSDLASTPRGSAGIFIRCITCQSKGAAAIQSARRKFAPVPQYFSNANDGRSIIMPMASGCVGLASGGRLALACRNASRCETSRASSLKPRPISSHLVATWPGGKPTSVSASCEGGTAATFSTLAPLRLPCASAGTCSWPCSR